MNAGSIANAGSDCSTDEDGIASSLGLTTGSAVKSKDCVYILEQLLGEGGFGAVFKVRRQSKSAEAPKGDDYFALKVEARQARQHNKLKMEIDILKNVSQTRKQNSHFTKLVDYGKHEELYVFIVMELVGKSLSDLKDQCQDRIFKLNHGLSIAKQCLEAIQDLHGVKYLHRDIKPANYACGREGKLRNIYLLDFGIARRFVNNEGKLKTPRASVNFKGTIRFASLNCHRNIELGCKDDCESWFYLMIDFILRGGLPWKRLENKADVLKSKEECRSDKKERLVRNIPQPCGEVLLGILKYIDSLKYEDGVDYDYIYHQIDHAAEVIKVDIDAPYPWEKHGISHGSH